MRLSNESFDSGQEIIQKLSVKKDQESRIVIMPLEIQHTGISSYKAGPGRLSLVYIILRGIKCQ
jgi:hypothetical protein